MIWRPWGIKAGPEAGRAGLPAIPLDYSRELPLKTPRWSHRQTGPGSSAKGTTSGSMAGTIETGCAGGFRRHRGSLCQDLGAGTHLPLWLDCRGRPLYRHQVSGADARCRSGFSGFRDPQAGQTAPGLAPQPRNALMPLIFSPSHRWPPPRNASPGLCIDFSIPLNPPFPQGGQGDFGL